jgi:hypothetical protein
MLKPHLSRRVDSVNFNKCIQIAMRAMSVFCKKEPSSPKTKKKN